MKSWPLSIAGVSSHLFNCSFIVISDVNELCYQYVLVIFFFIDAAVLIEYQIECIFQILFGFYM